MSESQIDKCPVCGWDIGETAREVEVGDAAVRVCCEECAQAVSADPTHYAP
jgi:hypothetical protein